MIIGGSGGGGWPLCNCNKERIVPAVHWIMVVCRFMRIDLHMAPLEDVYVEKCTDGSAVQTQLYMLNSVGMVL